jgi:hypothetical protein
MDYWKEAFIAALEEADMPVPPEDKLKLAAQVLEGAHENYGMAYGHDCIPNPQTGEIEKLNKEPTVRSCFGRFRGRSGRVI